VQRGVSNAAQSRSRLTTGKSKQVAGEKFAAAKTFIKKAVFCIDNLNMSVTADDVRQFVTGRMSVDVLSCF